MGRWNGKSAKTYLVNIHNDLIKAMQNKGARLCFTNDTPGITDEKNDTFWETEEEAGKSCRKLRHSIKFTAENGDIIIGYVSHWVSGLGTCTGTNIKNWFIIQPGTYPTTYIIEKDGVDIVVTDL